MNREIRQTLQTAAKVTGMCAVLQISLTLSSHVYANEPEPVVGTIDGPVVANTTEDVEELKEQIRQEQDELAEKDREELEELAEKGERLAQVVLGADFADEAQQILYAPDAANAALSDALAWYSLAAQRSIPGALSLDHIGVRFNAVRVVRNR